MYVCLAGYSDNRVPHLLQCSLVPVGGLTVPWPAPHPSWPGVKLQDTLDAISKYNLRQKSRRAAQREEADTDEDSHNGQSSQATGSATSVERVISQSSQPIHCAVSISCEDLQYFWEPLRNSSAQPILRMHSPTPMQIIDFVRAKVDAGGELGVKVACMVPLKIKQMAGK